MLSIGKLAVLQSHPSPQEDGLDGLARQFGEMSSHGLQFVPPLLREQHAPPTLPGRSEVWCAC